MKEYFKILWVTQPDCSRVSHILVLSLTHLAVEF